MTSYHKEWTGAGDPQCPKCNGAGFVYGSITPGHSDFGKAVPCQCHGWWKKQREQVSPFYNEPTFGNFKLVKGTQESFKFAKALANGTSDFLWLLIYGRPGCGKSHLLKAIYKVSKDRGVKVVFYNCPDLFSVLKDSISDNSVELVMRGLKEINLLILDEYGTEYGAVWERAKFDELMAYRFESLLPTVVATNLDISQIPERVRSRFGDKILSRCINNDAPDFRPLKR